MSTYKLWELANRDGVNGLLPYVEEAVLRLSESSYKSLGPRTPAEVGEPMARYIHNKVMYRARPLRPGDPTPPDPVYTHIAYPNEKGDGMQTWGDLAMVTMVEKMGSGVLGEQEVKNLAGSLQFQLKVKKLMVSGQGTGTACYFIRPWPYDLKWSHESRTHYYDEKIEKRIDEEADKPVTIYRSSRVVVGEVPDKITPEWAVATVKRLAEAFDKLSERYTRLESENAELAAKLEELTSDGWAEATDQLKAALS